LRGSASRPRQKRDRDRCKGYLLRFTRQVPVCCVVDWGLRVLNVPSIVSPFSLPVNVVSTGQSHSGAE